MPKPLHLTFKKEEQELYDWICTHSNKGGYIKDLIKADMISHKKQKGKIMKGFLTLEDE